MGEKNVELLEQNVKHNTEDIRELKKRMHIAEESIYDLKTNQRITNQNITHVSSSLNELKASFKELDKKMDEERDRQLKAYKKAVWQVAAAIITAFILIQLGLQ